MYIRNIEESVDFEGEFYRIKGGALAPRPVQQPYPPIYTPCLSPETHSWAANEGYPISSMFLPPDKAAESLQTYKTACEALDTEFEPNKYLLARHIYVADTKEQAVEDAKVAMLEFLRLFQNAAVPETKDKLESFPENFKFFTSFFAPFFGGELTYEGLIDSGLFICGDPETVAAEIQKQQKQIGFGQMICWMSFGNLPHEKVMKSMKLFGEKVMPRFNVPVNA